LVENRDDENNSIEIMGNFAHLGKRCMMRLWIEGSLLSLEVFFE
jgi:hypothetical protein